MYTQLKRIWELTPHSKATNSYELVKEVMALVKAEPKRLHMNQFVHVSLPDDNPDITRGPVCGTVACFAGWIHTLRIPSLRQLEKENDTYSRWSDDMEQETYTLFPAECKPDVYHLFWGQHNRDSNMDYPFPDESLYGTVEYARLAIANLQKFVDRWEDELKAFKLEPVVIRG